MDNDGTRRRSSLQDLFAERQVHVRSGSESRYVVLSRPLQIGVAAGLLAIVALLAAASYNAIAEHMARVAEQRTVADLRATVAQAQQAAEELAALRQRSEAADRENLQLTAELRQARDERAAALSASTEAGKKAAELEAALGATTAESRKLATRLQEARAAGGAPVTTEPARVEALLAEVTGLRAELDRVNRETEALRRTATLARQALQTAGVTRAQPAVPSSALATAAEPASDQMRRLQQDLAGAQATIATLSADLEAAKGAGTGAGAASNAAAVLATLKEQLGAANQRVERLGVTLIAQQSDAVPSELPADPAPLPPPPAPR